MGKSYTGKFVRLNHVFHGVCSKLDPNVAPKVNRPNLVINTREHGEDQDWAIPMFSSIPNDYPDYAKEILSPISPQLKTREREDCCLLYSKILPINSTSIERPHHGDKTVSDNISTRRLVSQRIMSKNIQVPELGMPYLLELQQTLRKEGILAFDCHEFVQNYQALIQIIFDGIVEYKKTNLNEITARAYEYIQHFRNNWEGVESPTDFTNFDRLKQVERSHTPKNRNPANPYSTSRIKAQNYRRLNKNNRRQDDWTTGYE